MVRKGDFFYATDYRIKQIFLFHADFKKDLGRLAQMIIK